MTEDDFASHRVDLTRQAYDDTLDVYRTGPVLFGVQAAQINQAQELHDSLVASLWGRSLDGAIGAQLDALGRIVGLYPRPSTDAGAITYFAPDVPTAGVDNAPVYVVGAPTAGQVPMGDPDYRAAIRVKIAKNHIRYGSPAELAYFAGVAWGINLSARNIGPSEIDVTVPPGTPGRIVSAIMTDITDETSDHQYGLPVPTTTKIRRVMIRAADAFAPDIESGAIDVAPIGVAKYG